jgi:hypothetical protein
MRSKLLALGLAVVLVSTAFGASAFTTANVDRAQSADVVADSEAVVAFEDGTSGDIVSKTSSGSLALSFDNLDAKGFNANANFSLGSTASPSSKYAFAVRNKAGTQKSYTLDYVPDNSSVANNGAKDIEFVVYSGGSEVGRFSEQGSDAAKSISVASGQALKIVVLVDTNGLSASSDLSGTLTIDV